MSCSSQRNKNKGTILLLLLVLVIVIALVLVSSAGAREGLSAAAVLGGSSAAASQDSTRYKRAESSKHVVVDVLNLTHWRLEQRGQSGAKLRVCDVIAAIDETAPCLRKAFPGQVMYVTKDRESVFNEPRIRAIYQNAARRNGVYIYVAEKYKEPPHGVRPSSEHSSKGRDDFLMSLLAWKYRCGVITADKLRDFHEFRSKIPPFHTIEYAWWRDRPVRDFIRPDAQTHARIRKPVTFHPSRYFC